MPRILFEKTGSAVWISHLDLMRLFQRAFKRAGLYLKHTQGFNPRPSVSIALPLSVGVESLCELLDFELEGETVPCAEITDRLNGALVSGVRVLECYEAGRKLRDLSFLQCALTLEYDGGIPEKGEERILELFASPSLIVPKRTKSGMQDQDIIPMIKSLTVSRQAEKELIIQAVVCCQNPTLNPAQMVAAIQRYLPELSPDHFVCRRLELYDKEEVIFR